MRRSSVDFMRSEMNGTRTMGSGTSAVALMVVLLGAANAIAAGEALTPVISPDGTAVTTTIPSGWQASNVNVEISKKGVADAQNQVDFFELAWSAGSLQIRAVAATRPAGVWTLKLTNQMDSRSGDFRYAYDAASGRFKFSNPLSPAAAPVAATLFGDSANTSAQSLGQRPNDIAELVITEATNWHTTSSSGDRRQYVAKFDAYPITSCKTIARIFRETATDLATPGSDVQAAYVKMKAKFDEFYKQGESRFRSVNPNKDDWQPFLQHLEQVIREKYAGDLTKADFAKWVVSELATGFDNLGKIWLDGGINRGIAGGGSTNASTQGGASGSDGYGYGYTRKAKIRCHCARLLF